MSLKQLLDTAYDHGKMTIVTVQTKGDAMERFISKSKFKPNALKYFRQIEQSGQELVITDRGKPTLRITPYRRDPRAALKALRDTVLRYDDPAEPVGSDDWEVLK